GGARDRVREAPVELLRRCAALPPRPGPVPVAAGAAQRADPQPDRAGARRRRGAGAPAARRPHEVLAHRHLHGAGDARLPLRRPVLQQGAPRGCRQGVMRRRTCTGHTADTADTADRTDLAHQAASPVPPKGTHVFRPSLSDKRPRRAVVAAASVAALALTLAACSGSNAGEDQGVITIFGSQGGQMDLNTNSFTLLLEEKFDLDIEFQTTGYDSAPATEARQVSLAGGDLPEAYMLVPWASQFTQAELLRYGDQGLILPLNDLIAEHAPAIADALEAEPDFATLATAPDGTIWGLPQWNDCYHCSYPYKFWINTEWLDTLGLEMPTTPEEFYDVMTAFKNDDPNGNGVADEIPITGSAQWSIVPFIMNAFIPPASNPGAGANSQPVSLGLDGDTVQMQTMQDGWREGLRFLHRMWEDGLIDQAAFSQGGDTMQATGNNAEAVIVGGFTAM